MEEVDNITHAEDARLYKLKKLHELKEKEWIAGNKKLLAIIGHDIKTPMSSIIGFLRLLKEGAHTWDRSKIEENVDIALISATKTYLLLDNLLQWAITENTIKSFQPEFIDFIALLHEEIENNDLFAKQKQVNIVTPAFSDEKAFADKNMVKSILRNLLTNAIKYSHKHGNIEISTTKNNGFLEVSIKDYGVGMKKEMVYTVLNTRNIISIPGTGNESGTGFGLLLCKELIDIHKGKIWIISRFGEGSEFKFTLPVSPQ
jgi:signal transduction histidine kinase